MRYILKLEDSSKFDKFLIAASAFMLLPNTHHIFLNINGSLSDTMKDYKYCRQCKRTRVNQCENLNSPFVGFETFRFGFCYRKIKNLFVVNQERKLFLDLTLSDYKIFKYICSFERENAKTALTGYSSQDLYSLHYHLVFIKIYNYFFLQL